RRRPGTASRVYAGPLGIRSANIDHDKLILGPHVQLKLISYLGGRFARPYQPYCFEMVPPGAQRLDRLGEVLISWTRRGMHVVCDQDRCQRSRSSKLPKRFMLGSATASNEAFNVHE